MKNRNIRLIIGTILLGLLFIAGTFSLYIWDANDNKDVVFNTSKKLQEYIIYDSGESKFIGDFQVGSSYTSGVHTTVSIKKDSEVNNIPLYATINMKVKSIGDNLSSEALKWTVTKGNVTSNGDVLASGNFSSLTTDSELALISNFEVTTTMSEYTIWIWLDETLASPSMSDETLDVSVWTQVDQIKANAFEVTTLTNSYQTIKATIVNSNKKIVSYQMSDSNTVPIVWIDIPTSEQNNIYNVEYTVNNTGVYYLWVKDETGKTISKRVEINSIDNTPPVCTWGDNTNINTNSTGTIILTCADNEIGVDKSTGTINISNITLSNSNITISNINREEINNGYKYTLTIKTGSTLGSTTMTVPSNIIKNTMNLGNEESSTIVTIADYYTISYKDVGNTDFSGTHEDEYATNYLNGDIVTLDIPTRKGYTFMGYYLSSVGSGDVITKLENQTGNLTLYADWKDNPPYGTASLSLASGKFTLKLSDQGDDGSGLTGTYGFALTTNSNCSAATYTDQTVVSKEYSGDYTNGTTYYGCIKLTDKSGSVAYLSSVGIKYNYVNVEQIYTTVGEQTFTVPETGTYKLEVWGAQGGGTNGGYGAYSVGSIKLNKDQKLYINVGGNTSTGTGGYNGGGSVVENVYGGGGATHIATVSGLLSTLSSKTSNILIVAGGGGGEGNSYAGGGGGGISGVNGVGDDKGTGGTQTAGGTSVASGSGGSMGGGTGAFGIGGTGDWYSESLGGGGGGYYGGGSGGGNGGNGGGGGGSGYIGNSLLTDKYMYCYNCTTSTDTATKTNTTTNVSDTPTANYAKSGDGAARITASNSANVTSLVLTYNNNDGSGCYTKTIVNGGTYGELCTPVRDGYSFDGWYTTSSGGTQITSSTGVTVTNNQTIYAHWTASTNPVITFNPDGNSSYVRGNVSSIVLVNKGSDNLDASTFKYTWSTDKNATADKIFMTGNSYTLENATGEYYLITEACDKSNNCTKKVSNIFYVDNTKPTGTLVLNSKASGGIVVTTTASDSNSGIKEYGYLIQTDSSCPTSGYTISKNNSYTFSVENPGTYYVCTKIIDNAGNENIVSNSIYHLGKPSEYSESGEYTYVVPLSGYYKLETWGAQGGGYNDLGGSGGYSVGTVFLEKNTKIYINVGGEGSFSSSETSYGGYNGGGNGYFQGSYENKRYYSSGGGATHIALRSGKLSTLSNNIEDILIVAGGGGGGYADTSTSVNNSGGDGGGYVGNNGQQTTTGWGSFGYGGTQTAGGKPVCDSSTCSSNTGNIGQVGDASGSFGQGGSHTVTANGGGGGYYGGGGSVHVQSAGGGSGYIGNNLLTDKVMYCYNCTTSNVTGLKTQSTTCKNTDAVQNCAKKGGGYAKITFLEASDTDNRTINSREYNYINKEQQFIVPVKGYYKIEAWGAQGGGYNNSGGSGGYSVGTVFLEKDTKIYINVGGVGNFSSTETSYGGYNGGGNGYFQSSYENKRYYSSGGGATHIALKSGLLSTLSNNIEDILIVAGGGGGGYVDTADSVYNSGGAGGGYIGNNGQQTTTGYGSFGYGGTQTSGGKAICDSSWCSGINSDGSFGQGGYYTITANGGGGGYYGGGGSMHVQSAGGGSGYIGNSLLSDKTMYCYNCTASSDTNTKTVSTTCTNSVATENCAKLESGYVKITYIGQ